MVPRRVGFQQTLPPKTYSVRAGDLQFAGCRKRDSSLLINTISDRPFENDEMQGARILRNMAYNPYAAMPKDEAQHGGSRFSTA